MKQLNPKVIWKNFFLHSLAFSFIFIFIFIISYISQYQTETGKPSHLSDHFLLWYLIIYILFLIFIWFLEKWNYHFYRYELGEKGVNIEKGIISKKYVSIPYNKIQNVNIYRGLLDQIMGLSILHIETAGFSAPMYSQQSEGKLPGLSVDVAENLKTEIIKHTNKN